MAFTADRTLRAILDSVADGVFTVDTDFNITFFNKAATRITGVAAADAEGRKCWEILHSSLCDGNCALGECMEQGTRIVSKPVYIVRADGAKLPISISASSLRDAEGELIGGVETFRDLSDIQLIRKEMEGSYGFEDIVGKSPAITRIFSIIPQISKSEASVLILGDSGTGKELFARAIHNLSPRSEGPFVAVNCGALPETLLESELFGYKAGAFTDAKKDKPGRFELARGGTIFLDEIGDLPQSLQVKLLRVLQERRFEPLGAVGGVKADVRVIAATNRDLEELVATGAFRQDLYYRLNVVTLKLPSLSQRPEDIPLLVSHFVRRFAATLGKAIDGVSDEVISIFMRHDFPGNVRELENILEFAFILCPGGIIEASHLPEHLRRQPDASAAAARPSHGPASLEEIKCRAVREALARNQGKRMKSCRELGVSKDTLRRMIARCREMGEE